MERASREDGDQAMPVSWLRLKHAFSAPTASWQGAAWRVQEGERRHQKVAQRVSKSPQLIPREPRLGAALPCLAPPFGPVPESRETGPRPHLGEGAILAAFRDKHRLLGLLGLLQGLSPLQATLALASV